jgi:endoglucanase
MTPKSFEKIRNHKYITIFTLLITVLTLGLTFVALPKAQAATYNYGEALQKAIYFYECQISGPKPSWSRVEWRGDSGMKDSVLGGWYDAGDHVKFGLPMAYTASMLGWAMYEYGDAFQNSGQTIHLKNNLKFVLDYFVNCDQGTKLVYQVGDGVTDHSWWGPVECIEKRMTRPSYAGNGSCVVGQTAAALAIGYLVLGDETYLTHAKSLFNLADSVRSDSGYTAANNFYTSWSGFWDELMWSALWLYLATGDGSYLAKAESYIPNLKKEVNTTEYEYKWAHCWDDSHVGAFLLLARITGNPEYHRFLQLHLDYWTTGYNGEKIKYTPAGLAWLDSWGSLRYATTQAFIAFVYSDFLTDATRKQRYQNFAINQVNYALGSNARNGSYEIGFGSNAPKHPHHRTAHGSWSNSQQIPPNHRHILYGALVGGPDSSDAYSDDISNYTTNEVACDYNAGFVGALAKMYNLYGGAPASGFPAPETRDDEFYMEAFGSSGSSSTDTRINAVNHSAWPARMVKNLSYNYYLDFSELFAAGYSAADVKVETFYQEIPVTVSSLAQWSGNIYYVKVTFTDGTDVWPGGNMEHSRELQLRFTAPVWNAANDYSATGMTGTSAKTKYITMYDGATLIWGTEPPRNGQTPAPTERPTATPAVTVTATPVITATPVRTSTPRRTATPVVTGTPTPVRTATPVITATPTVVPTATPVPATPTPVPVTGSIKVQFYNQSTAATSNQLYLNIKVVNTGSSAIALSNVKIRYYYTINGVQTQNFYCDYSPAGSSNVTGSFVTMSAPKTGADTYVEVGFTSGAGSLAAGGNTIVQARVAKSNWTNYTQTDDYSFNSSATTFADWTKVTGYVSGTLQWGVEP